VVLRGIDDEGGVPGGKICGFFFPYFLHKTIQLFRS
jgi:hypothetical protein